MSELEELRDYIKFYTEEPQDLTFNFKGPPSTRSELLRFLNAFIKHQEEKHYGDRR